MKLAIVQHGIGDHAEALKLTQQRHAQWSANHGCAYLTHWNDLTKPPQTRHWNKLISVRKAMDAHDAVFWLDTDTVVRDLTVSPCSAIDGVDLAGTYYKTTLRRGGVFWPFMGLGVFAIRTNPRTLQLMDDILAKGPVLKPITRQGPIFDEVRFNLELDKRPDITVNKLSYLWNYFKDYQLPGYPFADHASYSQAAEEAERTCVIKAWHGTPPDTATRRIKEYLCQL